MMTRNSITLFLILFPFLVFAQQRSVIYGTVKDENGKPLALVSISIAGTSTGTKSNDQGEYELSVPSDSVVKINFVFVGYKTQTITTKLQQGEQRKIDQRFSKKSVDLNEVVIQSDEERRSSITKIDPKLLANLPSASGSFEAILKTLPGVTSNNELSSQYNVRGGNFDENLVYVNDVEIYRPFLIRSGQQEGLSFINSDMVSGVKFSAGGFDAKYGDKLSSVLDITYKKPRDFGGSVSAGLLGEAISLEGTSKSRRTTYLLGVRHKTNKYLLSSLDTKGEYQPSFVDVQTYITYDLSTAWEIGFLGNYSRNKYSLVPEDRETTFGTFNELLRLRIFFEGQEVDQYESGFGALTATYSPNNNLSLKFISSVYNTLEEEKFDIEGSYIFDEIEADFGKETFGQVKANRGIGGYLNHARNYLDATISNLEHKGTWSKRKNLLQWGVKYQNEIINDRISEWNLIDSAGHAQSGNEEVILLHDVVKAKISLNTNRYSSYIQNSFFLSDTNSITLTVGVRTSYWDYNEELNVSPRVTVSIKPEWKRDVLFRASVGYYYQPPFYREIRDLSGKLNPDPKSQQSIHYVIASDYNFTAFGTRKFKFISEFYYKDLRNLIPYEVDNVRIRYYANNTSKGYAAGVDFKVNGEFVKDLESWFSLSFLTIQEDVNGDFYYLQDQEGNDSLRIEPGYIPRPTDQRVNFSIFFQDKLLKDPSVKVHLNSVFGSRLPFGPPDFNRYKDTLRMPPYWRVDIGFSKEFIGPRSGGTSKIWKFKSLMLYAEVFNLFKRSNTVSYLWITDVQNQQYAVPNYLTSRQLNLRVVAKF
jgi:hypothetical protein